MSTARSTGGRPDAPARPFNVWDRLKEIDTFFAGNDKVHETLRRTAKGMEEAGISSPLAGGMAVNLHRAQRTTADVEFLPRCFVARDHGDDIECLEAKRREDEYEAREG